MFLFLFLQGHILSMTWDNHDDEDDSSFCSENMLEWLGLRAD
jgi:hypothetical protein